MRIDIPLKNNIVKYQGTLSSNISALDLTEFYSSDTNGAAWLEGTTIRLDPRLYIRAKPYLVAKIPQPASSCC